MRQRLAALLLVLLAGCPTDDDSDTGTSLPGTQVMMSFDRTNGLYDAPYPSDDLIQSNGLVDISAFPNNQQTPIVAEAVAMIDSTAHGFSQAAGIYFQLTADLQTEQLPTLADSIESNATVFLIGVQQGAPDYLKRYPVKIVESANGGFFGPSHLLAILPLQGIALRPGTRYAAVVLRSVLDVNGAQLGRSTAMGQLASGKQPLGLPASVFAEYSGALASLKGAGIAANSVAGLTVFTTDTPQAGFAAVVQDMLAQPTPVPGPFTLANVYSNYCVFQSTVAIPDYQQGVPPFTTTGGNWVFDSSGHPMLQRTEMANVVLTIPQSTMPTAGYPASIFIPTGGGTAVPLTDRGVETAAMPNPVPGTGPAMEYATVGFAGMSIDGPEDGARNVTGNPANEDALMFNVNNPPALRDNIREDAAEVVLHAHILAALSLDVTGCPGAGTVSGSTIVHFDSSHFAVQGHSMGASVAPLPAAYEPLYRAMVVDGAGASYVENIMFKQQPESLLQVAELLLGYEEMPLTETDPVVSLVQWAIEPSDSLVYARNIVQEPLNGSSPRNVLMFQGIVDRYIMPTIADALTLSLGIDLAGPAIDAEPCSESASGAGYWGLESGAEAAVCYAMSASCSTTCASTEFCGVDPASDMTLCITMAYTPLDTPIMDLISFSGRGQVNLPASGNFGAVTAVVTQDPGDGYDDGHEMMFQTAPPKNQYRCFLQTYAAGMTPTVPQGTGTCP